MKFTALAGLIGATAAKCDWDVSKSFHHYGNWSAFYSETNAAGTQIRLGNNGTGKVAMYFDLKDGANPDGDVRCHMSVVNMRNSGSYMTTGTMSPDSHWGTWLMLSPSESANEKVHENNGTVAGLNGAGSANMLEWSLTGMTAIHSNGEAWFAKDGARVT